MALSPLLLCNFLPIVLEASTTRMCVRSYIVYMITLVWSYYNRSEFFLLRSTYLFHQHEYKKHIKRKLATLIVTNFCLLFVFFNQVQLAYL